MGMVFLPGLSVQAMEDSQRDAKRIKLEDSLTTSRSENSFTEKSKINIDSNGNLKIKFSEFKQIIDNEQGGRCWRDICTKVTALLLVIDESSKDEKFTDDEFRTMGNMIKLKSIGIIGKSNVYKSNEGILYSGDSKILYFCPPHIDRNEIKTGEYGTEIVMWQSIRRAEEVSVNSITVLGNKIKNERYQDTRKDTHEDDFLPSPSAADKLKKEKQYHLHRKKYYGCLQEYSLTPFKTLSERLSCISCGEKDRTFSFSTPFGIVKCEKKKTKEDDDYYISVGGVYTSYCNIVKTIRAVIEKGGEKDVRPAGARKCKIINAIYEYISQPDNPNIRTFNDFSKHECKKIEGINLSEYERKVLAAFSAILMLSEPARNHLGGKLERAALREWMGHPDATSIENRNKRIDFIRWCLRRNSDITGSTVEESENEMLQHELKMKKIDENTGSMDKIFDNEKFKGEDKLKVPYKMSLKNGKGYVDRLINGELFNESLKESSEWLNRSISPVEDADADKVYQSK